MKSQLIQVSCRRCGSALLTRRTSLFNADTLKAELGSICSGCITNEERERIVHETMQSAMDTLLVAPRHSPPTRKS